MLPNTAPAGNVESTPIGNGLFVLVRPKMIRQCFYELDPGSAFGADGIPSVVLKRMRYLFETPITKIFRKIVADGVWPDLWKLHWICPLFKKGLTSKHEQGS